MEMEIKKAEFVISAVKKAQYPEMVDQRLLL